MSSIALTFPSLGRIGTFHGQIISREFDLNDSESCDFILNIAINYQRSLSTGRTADLVLWTNEFIQDVVALKNTLHDVDGQVVADFFRYILSTGVIIHTFGTGQYNRCGDWILISLSDDFEILENQVVEVPMGLMTMFIPEDVCELVHTE